VLTRPEPTIYGNCDSWDFIVWKSDPKQRPLALPEGPLQASNRKVMHNISTISG
jgi:hypothetical protein